MSIERAEIVSRIRDVIAEHGSLGSPADTLPVGADLFAAGMTSFASVNVVLALEESFDVEFPDDMLRREVLDSIDSLSEAIESLLAA